MGIFECNKDFYNKQLVVFIIFFLADYLFSYKIEGLYLLKKIYMDNSYNLAQKANNHYFFLNIVLYKLGN